MARHLGRITCLFVLAVLLAAPWSAAADGPRAGGATSPRVLDQAWSWLSTLWSQIGCGMDPNGICRPAQENRDIGCLIDPSGICRDSAEDGQESQRDIGCIMDPNGVCGQ